MIVRKHPKGESDKQADDADARGNGRWVRFDFGASCLMMHWPSELGLCRRRAPRTEFIRPMTAAKANFSRSRFAMMRRTGSVIRR